MERRGWLKVSGATSCLVSALSILYPFLQVQWLNVMPTFAPVILVPQTYWSFKGTYIVFAQTNHVGVAEYWFQDYWSKNANYRTMELGLRIDVILTLMLTAQILTLLLAASATIKAKHYLFLSATLLNILTAFCMWLTSRAFAYLYVEYTFQPGFWLALTATALFFATFLAARIKKAYTARRLSPETHQ